MGYFPFWTFIANNRSMDHNSTTAQIFHTPLYLETVPAPWRSSNNRQLPMERALNILFSIRRVQYSHRHLGAELDDAVGRDREKVGRRGRLPGKGYEQPVLP
jgi:hypothetical protein